MHSKLSRVCALLDQLSDRIRVMNSADGATFSQTNGWNLPSITPHQMYLLPRNLSKSLRRANIESISTDQDNDLSNVAKTIEAMTNFSVQNTFGNLPEGLRNFIDNMSYIHMVLTPFAIWGQVDEASMPVNIAQRIKRLDAELDKISPEKIKIEESVKTILSARKTVNELPSLLRKLTAAQDQINQTSISASEHIGRIAREAEAIQEFRERSDLYAQECKQFATNASEAYRVTTTVGLAAAFSERAESLNTTILYWVGGLVFSLGVIATIGYVRFDAMREALNATVFDPTRVWSHVALSALSVGAPIWFSWVATKQIAQRFRLAEDYAFKAAVAKAYEGYRREAARIDPSFEKALFASALNRLDEAPLRFVELTTPGSPAHELASSSAAQKFFASMRNVPAKLRPKPAAKGDTPA